MTDKLLVTLAAFLLAGGVMAARADVTLLGNNNASPAGDDTRGSRGDSSSGCTSGCSFGFNGSQDLGNGLKAVAGMDWQYAAGNTGTTTPMGRDQWLGIGGDFGEVKVGTLSSRYKSRGAVPDPVYDSLLPFRENTQQSATADHNRNEGVGLSYENAGILVFADYIDGKAANNDAAYKVGAKYTMDNISVFGQYKIDNSLTNGVTNGVEAQTTPGSSADMWFLGGGLTLGNSSLYAGYGKGDDGVNASALSGYNSWEIVGVQAVGKSTSVYAGYSGAGCIDKNPDACNKTGTVGVDDDKFSLGIKHKF